MEKRLFLTVFIVNTGLASVPPNNRIGTVPEGMQENFRHLLDSINENNMKKTYIYRHFLEQEAGREKQAFDTIKEEFWLPRRKNAQKQEISDRKSSKDTSGRSATFKREVGKCETVANKSYDEGNRIQENNDSRSQQLEKRKALAKRYCLAVLRARVVEFEKILVLSLPLDDFTTGYVDEVYDSMEAFIKLFPGSIDKTLWSAHKVEMRKEMSKVEANPDAQIVAKVPYHYNLWRTLLEYSPDELIKSMKAKYQSDESRRQACARIASLFLFDGSDDIQIPEDYKPKHEEVIEGMKEKLGIDDEKLLEIVEALFNDLKFPKKKKTSKSQEAPE